MGISGERRERSKSRNMYKGIMDKDHTGEDRVWERSVGREGESNGEKMGTTVIEQQYKILEKNIYMKWSIQQKM